MVIAVDAMGGDHAPDAVVEGALQAVNEYGVAVLLVGDQEAIRRELDRIGGEESPLLTIRHASENIEMGESPIAALRGKPDSSLRVAIQAVKAGEAGAVVSAGNSGAMLALAVLAFGLVWVLYGLPFLPLSFFGFYAYRKKKLLRRKAVSRAAA